MRSKTILQCKFCIVSQGSVIEGRRYATPGLLFGLSTRARYDSGFNVVSHALESAAVAVIVKSAKVVF